MNWIFFTKKIERNNRKEPKGEREGESAGTEQKKDKYLLPVQAGFVCMPPKPPAGMEMRRKDDETYEYILYLVGTIEEGAGLGTATSFSEVDSTDYTIVLQRRGYVQSFSTEL